MLFTLWRLKNCSRSSLVGLLWQPSFISARLELAAAAFVSSEGS